MAFSIKDEETDRLVRALAELTGENYTRTVLGAVQEKLARLQKNSKQAKQARNQKMQEFLDSRRHITNKGWSQKRASDALWE